MKLLLCGPPGVGKTTIAHLAAASLGQEAVDTDDLIEKTFGKPPYELYKMYGEEKFRVLEKTTLVKLASLQHGVIALGGGILARPCEGLIIYLQASYATLFERLSRRPKLPAFLDSRQPKNSYIERVACRLPHYEAMADRTIATDSLQPESIVDIIRGCGVE